MKPDMTPDESAPPSPSILEWLEDADEDLAPPSPSLLEQVKDIDLWPAIAARLPHA